MLDFSKDNLSIDQLIIFLSENNCDNLSQSSLIKLKNNQEKQLSSLQHIPKNLRNKQDKSQLAILELSNKVLDVFIGYTTQSPSDLYELLSIIQTESINSGIANIISNFKLAAVRKLISVYKDKLVLEKRPLAFAVENHEFFDGSIQLAALILYLLESGIKVDAIVSSTLLHKYFRFNFANLNQVAQCYHLVKTTQTAKKQQTAELLEKVSTITTGEHLHTFYNLKGEQPGVANLKTIVKAKINYNWIIEKNNLFNLYTLFGPQLIVNILSFLKSNNNAKIKSTVKNVIGNLSQEKIAGLYHYINTQISSENGFRNNILNQLNEYIHQELTLSLIENRQVSPWSMLYSRQELVLLLNSDDIEKLKINFSININEIKQAFALAANPRLGTLKALIYLTIAQIILKNTAIELSKDIIFELRLSPEVQSFINEETKQCKKELNKCIDDNLEKFASDSLITISDFSQLNKNKYKAINKLSTTPLVLPENTHQRDAFIIERVYLKAPELFNEKNLENILDVMHPAKKYAFSFRGAYAQEELSLAVKRAKTQVALESLAIIPYGTINNFIIGQCDINFSLENINVNNAGLIFVNLFEMDKNPNLHNFFLTIKGNLTTLIKDGGDLGYTLKHLNEAQCKIVLDEVKDKLSILINGGLGLAFALEHLNEKQRQVVFTAVIGKLSTCIESGHGLAFALQYLNEIQRQAVFDAVIDRLSPLIISGYSLSRALEYLNEKQRQIVFTAVIDNLSTLITDGQGLSHALTHLNEAQRQTVFDAVIDNFCAIIKDGFDLWRAFSDLNEAQRQRAFDIVKSDLSIIIKSDFELSYSLKCFNKAQKTELFSNRQFVLMAMHLNRSNFSKGSEELQKDISLQIASYVPFMAFALLHPEASKSILLGLAITAVVTVSAMTGGLSLLPSAAIAVSAGALTGYAGFFAIKASGSKPEKIARENKNTLAI